MACITEKVQHYFVDGQLTEERLKDLKYQRGRTDYQERSRISDLVGVWITQGKFRNVAAHDTTVEDDTEDDDEDLTTKSVNGKIIVTGNKSRKSPKSNDVMRDAEEELMWWRAERISTPLVGADEGQAAYIVTLPLIPEDEAIGGKRSVIDAQFPMLKWDTVDGSMSERETQHLSNEGTVLQVKFRVHSSNRTLRAQVQAVNELHLPKIADKQFPVTAWSRKMYEYMLSLQREGNLTPTNLFQRYPHMSNVFSGGDVPPVIASRWAELDDGQQAAYRCLCSTYNDLGVFIGQAGTGKSRLVEFIILNAPVGGSNGDIPKKALIFQPQNTGVNDTAKGLHDALSTMGHEASVIRLHAFETEINDWLPSKRGPRDSFDMEDAQRACTGYTDEFLVQVQLARFAINAEASRKKFAKPRYKILSLSQAAAKHFQSNKSDYPELCDLMDQENADRTQLKTLVSLLFDAFLDKFTGVVIATPLAGCKEAFICGFHPDFVAVGDAGRLPEIDLYQIVRFHSPKFMVVVGDPDHLAPFVRIPRMIPNPWLSQARISFLGRAVNIGDVVTATLAINHRGKGNLIQLPLDLIYNGQLKNDGNGIWSEDVIAYHEFLKKLCPTLDGKPDCDGTPGDAVKDLTLRSVVGDKTKSILIIAMYSAQVYQYRKQLDAMVLNGELSQDERAMISIRTVDGAQGCSADLVIVDFVQTFRPGFTTNHNRICVALTRARAAEIILMTRGIFLEYKGDNWSSVEGEKWDILHRIYEAVSQDKGIVTLAVSEDELKEAGLEVEQPDEGARCKNCDQKGHRHKQCVQPLRCRKCLRNGHVDFRCTNPPANVSNNQ
ncbi:P-loop containing nucleoside triphosphate hydrolase protein [Coniochaeta sp. 2T2.1]|nr:P-loop containing nucleoside triphosphate hydrolase protein [Coniochaeta sp. 2T2.1]